MIHKSITISGNITKIITPIELTPHPQITMANKPLTPIVLIHLNMPTHKEGIHMIHDIQQTLNTLPNTHKGLQPRHIPHWMA